MRAVGATAMDVVEALGCSTLEMMAVVPLPVVSVRIIECAVIAPIAVIEGAIIAVIIAVVIVGAGDAYTDDRAGDAYTDAYAADMDSDTNLGIRGNRAKQRQGKNRSDKNFHTDSLSLDREFRLIHRIRH
jgi:hypothetical protein